MVWLAIDTSTDCATFALKVGNQLYEREQAEVRTHAQTILLHIDELLKEAHIELQDLQGLLVGRGPGSFTGLRVACAVAKGLAFPHQLPIYPVSNLAWFAWMARSKYPNETILSVMDARMQQVYWALYPKDCWEAKEQVHEMANIPNPKGSFVLAGYHFHEYQAQIPKNWSIIAEMNIIPKAYAMIEMLEENLLQSTDALHFEPVYIRDHVTQGKSNG